jgi:hypothetical protein
MCLARRYLIDERSYLRIFVWINLLLPHPPYTPFPLSSTPSHCACLYLIYICSVWFLRLLILSGFSSLPACIYCNSKWSATLEIRNLPMLLFSPILNPYELSVRERRGSVPRVQYLNNRRREKQLNLSSFKWGRKHHRSAPIESVAMSKQGLTVMFCKNHST